MNAVRDIVTRALEAEDAIIEEVGPDSIALVAPPALQHALSISEFSRVEFGDDVPPDSMRVGLESEWIEILATRLRERGKLLETAWTHGERAREPSRPEDLLKRHVVFGNATFRFRGMEPAWTRYLMLVFRLTAVSDERREDILPVCLNESNATCADHLLPDLMDRLRAGEAGARPIPSDVEIGQAWTAEAVADWGRRCLPAKIRSRLSPFLVGMRRRMANDMDRLHAYHTDLRNEAAKRGGRGAGETGSDERVSRRIKSIEREYEAKVADLNRKYAMNVDIALLQALRVTMPVHRIRMRVLRRKGTRDYHLDWNDVFGHVDHLTCEACGVAGKTHVVCDDRLHMLCPSCLGDCGGCGKAYCRACNLMRCPRCGTAGVAA